jgi:hypothetical protein
MVGIATGVLNLRKYQVSRCKILYMYDDMVLCIEDGANCRGRGM